MGVTAAVGALGLTIAPRHSLGQHTASFLLALMLFHYAGVLVNDAMDVGVDRLSGRRRNSPLASGEVSSDTGRRLGLVCLAGGTFAVIATKDAWPAAVLLFIGAGGCMLTYNVYGKRVHLPLIMDVVQGVAWGLFTLWASSVVSGDIFEALLISTAVTVYMTQVNAIHGGIRDAEIDKRAGRITTALLLGVKTPHTGGLQIPQSLRVVAFTLQAGLLSLGIAWALSSQPARPSQILSFVASCGLFAGGFILLSAGMRSGASSARRESCGVCHIAITFQAIAFLSAANGGWQDLILAQALGVVLVLPLLGYTFLRSMGRFSRHG
ncbi:UbiA family prenyltransferase [Streptomyces nigra]|uniref:UbiA family prenyltransferase n=1 Tax=Streptomyces nigra TaxID=1827580 RepID=UPI00381EE98F